MSTRCNIILREESNLRREVILYKHNGGDPNTVIKELTDMLKSIYTTFEDGKVTSWISNPSKVASMISHLSVPVATDEMKKAMKSFTSDAMLEFFKQQFMTAIPTIEPDNARFNGCDYEYTITLSEKMEKGELTYSYQLEVARVQNGKKSYTISEDVYKLGGEYYGERLSDSEETGSGSDSTIGGSGHWTSDLSKEKELVSEGA